MNFPACAAISTRPMVEAMAGFSRSSSSLRSSAERSRGRRLAAAHGDRPAGRVNPIASAAFFLPTRQGLNRCANLLTNARGGKQPQTQHGGDEKLNIGIQFRLEPHANIFRQQFRDHQIPGKELHDQRHVGNSSTYRVPRPERKRFGTVRKMPNKEPTRKR